MRALAKNSKVAVIGGGVSGIVTSFLLQKNYKVSLFEANNYLGGHTNTFEIKQGEDAGLAIDTGFIVLNDKNYPNLHKFLNRLNVETRYSDMSFSYYEKNSGFCYAGTNLFGLFANKRNIVSHRFWAFFKEIKRFCKLAQEAIYNDLSLDISIKDFLIDNKFSSDFIERYLVPMAAAIWSASQSDIFSFPARTLFNFFNNHGLLSLKDRPNWQTVVGGSHSYVKQFKEQFSGEIYLKTPINSIFKNDNGTVGLNFINKEKENFDAVIIATHADQALKLLMSPSKTQQKLLGVWSYKNNHTVLHTDTNFLPKNKNAWASWNYVRNQSFESDSPVTVTYDMNRLQGLTVKKRYCVTLNPQNNVSPQCIIAEFNYAHPTFTKESVSTQKELSKIQGQDNIYFCGSYFGYGFHEDAVNSAVEVGKYFGASL